MAEIRDGVLYPAVATRGSPAGGAYSVYVATTQFVGVSSANAVNFRYELTYFNSQLRGHVLCRNQFFLSH